MKNQIDAFENAKNDENDNLVEYTVIEKTPFTVVEVTDENGNTRFWVVLGKYRICEEPFTSFDAAEEYALDVTWEKITTVMSVMINENKSILNAYKELENAKS